jgi:hypothetical protein
MQRRVRRFGILAEILLSLGFFRSALILICTGSFMSIKFISINETALKGFANVAGIPG